MLFVPRAAGIGLHYRYSTIIILVQSIVVVTATAAAVIDAKSTNLSSHIPPGKVQLLFGMTIQYTADRYSRSA